MDGHVVKALFDRELGTNKSQTLMHFEHETILDFQISNRKMLSISPRSCPSRSPRTVTWLALEKTKHQHLLASTKEGNILLFNIKVPTEYHSSLENHFPVTPMDCHHSYHRGEVSCVVWYPIDDGIFITSSLDSKIIVWSTNRLEAVLEWNLPTAVNSLAMSELQNHCLIAAGTEDGSIRICDLNSGSHLHSLLGHTKSVLALTWSKTNSYELISGGSDGQLRLWDIRRPGSILFSFDNDEREDSTRAHHGVINAVQSTADGKYWISAGTDDRIQLWDTGDHCRELTIHQEAFNRSRRPRQLSITDDDQLLFFPSGSIVQVYSLENGELRQRLKVGGLSSINCCMYNSDLMEFYIGFNDQCFLAVLEPFHESGDCDSWSD